MSQKTDQETLKKTQSLIGNREQKASTGKSGFNQKIADMITSNNGLTVSEAGKALYPDYDPKLDTSASKGKNTRKVMRETRAGLARKGYEVFKVKIAGYDQITIACKPENSKAKIADWREQGAEVTNLFSD